MSPRQLPFAENDSLFFLPTVYLISVGDCNNALTSLRKVQIQASVAVTKKRTYPIPEPLYRVPRHRNTQLNSLQNSHHLPDRKPLLPAGQQPSECGPKFEGAHHEIEKRCGDARLLAGGAYMKKPIDA